jgi:deoxycytidylate deaminase
MKTTKAKQHRGTRHSVASASDDEPLIHEDNEGRSNEIVIGIVGPVGTDAGKIASQFKECLAAFRYRVEVVKFSEHVIPVLSDDRDIPESPPFKRRWKLMDLGNRLREETADAAVLAKGAAAVIASRRESQRGKDDRIAYIVTSFKHPDEVGEFRKIYGGSFYLFAVHVDEERRTSYLAREMTRDEAVKLIVRDEHENQHYGQHTRDTFHLADFFLADEKNDDKLQNSIQRCLELIFGRPTLTPTFNEFAMFMAFAASLRSADLSRQVGAVIARKNEILSTGANDCPAPGGGLYWPEFIGDRVDDAPRGRDYKRGFDSNTTAKNRLANRIASDFAASEEIQTVAKKSIREAMKNAKLKINNETELNQFSKQVIAALSGKLSSLALESGVKDVTEYGRVVHAEMEAILACARNNVSCLGATIYCTTFPCHNCAKHIIAAGIEQVIYVEPYPKSKAIEFHDEAVSTEKVDPGDKTVRFKPFIGVAPRQFFNLFSMSLSSGRKLKRKNDIDGSVVSWLQAEARPRVPVLLYGTRKFEFSAGAYIGKLISS